jgi:hypothetical protein
MSKILIKNKLVWYIFKLYLSLDGDQAKFNIYNLHPQMMFSKELTFFKIWFINNIYFFNHSTDPKIQYKLSIY